MIKNFNIYIGLVFIFGSFSFSGYEYYQRKLLNHTSLQASKEKTEEGDSSLQKEVEKNDDTIVKVSARQTLKAILKTKGLDDKRIGKILKSLKASVGDFSLSEGQELSLSIRSDESCIDLDILKFRPMPECEIQIKSNGQDGYDVEKKSIELTRKLRFVSGKMTGSFYNSAKASGLPAKLVKGASVALGYVVNFQHDIKKGDTFQFLYESFEDPDGKVAKTGNVLFISLSAKGKNYELYGYNVQGKRTDYFTKEGEGVVRGFLQTPLDGRRIRVTSGFTLKGRMHPIKGFCRAHKGVDFGAPYGTAILAAADGVVVQSGYDGDYGNKITIAHANGYKTVYAHLSKIKIKKGMAVKQRQVIGNVGSTGLSTGPHLHFETIAHNVHVNPMSIKQMPIQKLSGDLLRRFKDHVFFVEKEITKFNPLEVTVVTASDKNV